MDLARRAELLARLPGVSATDADVPLIAERVAEHRYAAGDVIISEGDEASELFIVADGEAEVTTQGRWLPKTLAVVAAGEIVGELAMVLPGRRRNATLTARTDVVALAIDRDLMEVILAGGPRRPPAFEEHALKLLVARFISEVSVFSSLSDYQRQMLAKRLRVVEVAAGDTIVTAGEPGDSCFILRSGEADVVRADGTRLDACVPGDLIGEGALVTRQPRKATVRALQPCELLEMKADDLYEISLADPEIAAEVTYLFRLRSRPQRGGSVKVNERVTPESEVITTLVNPVASTYFRLSERGRFVWDRLDGSQTLRDLTVEYNGEFGTLSPYVVADLVVSLARADMLEDKSVGFVPRVWGPRITGFRRIIRFAARYTIRQWEVRWVDRAIGAMYRSIGHLLLKPVSVAILSLVALSGLVAFGYELASGSEGLQRNPELVAFSLLSGFIAVVIHEISHGLAVKRFGGRIPSGGVGFFWARPCAFVDTSEMWLQGPRERIIVSLAGPFSGLVIGGALTLAAVAVPDAKLATVLWAMSLPILIGVGFNLAPFIELDGYHVLTDLVGVPNLRSDAVDWSKRWLATGRHERHPHHRLLLGYAAGSIAYMTAMVAVVVTIGQLVLHRWLSGLIGDPAALVFAWVLVAVQVFIIVGTMFDEYAFSGSEIAASHG